MQVNKSETFRNFLMLLYNPRLLPLHTLLHPQGTTAFCHGRLVLRFLKSVNFIDFQRTCFWFFGFFDFFF